MAWTSPSSLQYLGFIPDPGADRGCSLQNHRRQNFPPTKKRQRSCLSLYRNGEKPPRPSFLDRDVIPQPCIRDVDCPCVLCSPPPCPSVCSCVLVTFVRSCGSEDGPREQKRGWKIVWRRTLGSVVVRFSEAVQPKQRRLVLFSERQVGNLGHSSAHFATAPAAPILVDSHP